jgi:hypothetical protein
MSCPEVASMKNGAPRKRFHMLLKSIIKINNVKVMSSGKANEDEALFHSFGGVNA